MTVAFLSLSDLRLALGRSAHVPQLPLPFTMDMPHHSHVRCRHSERAPTEQSVDVFKLSLQGHQVCQEWHLCQRLRQRAM